MVAAPERAANHTVRLKTATVKHVVDTEKKAICIIRNHRPEANLRIHLTQTEIGQTTKTVAVGHIIEIATHYHIFTAIMLYIAAYQLDLGGAQTSGFQQLGKQLASDLAHAAAVGMAIGDTPVQLLVLPGETE